MAFIQLVVKCLDKPESTTINITQKDIKRLIKTLPSKPGEPKIHHLHYPIHLPGLYRLEKVVDISQLVVRVRKSELLVASCPSASFVGDNADAVTSDKCRGELSDLNLEVRGLPPLQVRYSRVINQDGKDVTIQNISPVGYSSPLIGNYNVDGTRPALSSQDLAWARSQKILIPLNESLASPGSWNYIVEEVIDGMGNLIKYSSQKTGGECHLQKSFNVHERPSVRFLSCSPQNPIMVARGKSGALALEITRDVDAAPYEIQYSHNSHVTQGDDSAPNELDLKKSMLKSSGQPISVSSPGLYTIKSISSRFCSGEVFEPSSCLFLTPPDPGLAISYDEIVDRCAGSSIGLTIDMDLAGSPPFRVYYRTIKDKRDITVNTIVVPGTRHQLRLTPAAAGLYTYEFYAIDDKVYDGVGLDFKKLSVKQHIIPNAGASFVRPNVGRRCCIGESTTFTVDMQGSGPWSLEYELVHGGKRTKFQDENITVTPHLITTPELVSGGEYSLVLTNVQDSHGCRVFLESEARVEVRRQRPSVSFAEIDGSRTARILESEQISLPLRLVGEKPFRVKYRFTDENEQSSDHDIVATEFNSILSASKRGRYQLLTVHDVICPGTVTETANVFDISWIPRPRAHIVSSPSTTKVGGVYVRNPICEGDEDAMDLALEGKPPFLASFQQIILGDNGDSKGSKLVEIKAGTNRANLRMDTLRSGLYRYDLHLIADASYIKPGPPSSPLLIEQRVNARPSARFKSPGKVHKYCLEAGTGDDTIPIILEGVAPFILSIGVKHYSSGKEEIINIPNIDSNNYVFRVPHHVLALGGHAVRIHKVRDSRGCSQKYGIELPHVSVAVAELPSITSLDPKPYYCVGDRINYSLAGTPPFILEYTFAGKKEKVTTSSIFQRIAERPGVLTFNSVKDSASDCRVELNATKDVHRIPSTTEEYQHTIVASLEGTYEVVSIHDKYCGYAAPRSKEYNAKYMEQK
ncbi:hypothetical protein Dda_8432 [Drechslerella dactyloides]|uniref:Uncharacterized protein n=1 Tax=Drechslerella dactyloides TaxID=74499 RepID=A0AAD6NH98_DREDA|nr:hypothetical protein Dda_8432 [Drechslerella dactyloides]